MVYVRAHYTHRHGHRVRIAAQLRRHPRGWKGHTYHSERWRRVVNALLQRGYSYRRSAAIATSRIGR